MHTELLIIGAGGHSKVVIEAIRVNDELCRIMVADHDMAKQGEKLLGNYVIRALHNWSSLPDSFHIAIGKNEIRKQLAVKGLDQGKEFFSIIHKRACVSDSCNIGNGSFIAANAILAAESKVERGCIINHAAVVDHDCVIGAFSHVAPNATLGGGVQVGEECLIGAGAIILPLVNIGSGVTVGAGAVVTNDIEDNQIVVGVPARCVVLDE
jgi:sugar O-acyltransferase (sialic acid O-acetyltransferase NeuD family)